VEKWQQDANKHEKSECKTMKNYNKEGLHTISEMQKIFRNALKTGRLSKNKKSKKYVGNYMYMGTINGKDEFKHAETRKYI